MENKFYIKRENTYQQVGSGVDIVNLLPKGVYNLNYDSQRDEFSLEWLKDKFDFGFKLYGLDMKFIHHVTSTYWNQKEKNNIGILLNGEKGAGKTVTAKYICNELNLPVIICGDNYPGIDSFISTIEQDCIFFFDEFEKNFESRNRNHDDNTGEKLLSVMDGLNNSNNVHIFILTTNKKNIDNNLLSRPSRIRYVKEYESILDKSVVVEYLNDNLLYKEYFDSIIKFFSKMESITMDMLKCVVDEVNLHNCPVSDFEEFFNFTEKEYTYYGIFFEFQCSKECDLVKEINEHYKQYADTDTNSTYLSGNIAFAKPIENLTVGDLDYYSLNQVFFVDMKRNIVVLSEDGVTYEMYIVPQILEKNKRIGKAEKSWQE